MDKCGVQTNKSTLEKDQGSYLELLFTMTKHKDKFCHHNYAREVPKILFFIFIDSVPQSPPPPPPTQEIVHTGKWTKDHYRELLTP